MQQASAYEDFELEVGGGTVRLRKSPAGEVRPVPFQIPYDQEQHAALRSVLERAAKAARSYAAPVAMPSLDDPQQIGQKLFEALFPPEIHQLYTNSRAIIRDRGKGGLRIKLRLAEDVERLPWELLYDPLDDYLALVSHLSLVRYLEVAMPSNKLTVDGPLRVLLVAGWPGEPNDPLKLDLADEIAEIRKALQGPVSKGRVFVDVLERATLEDLFKRQRTDPFHIVHYLGHGEAPSDGAPARLLFHDRSGNRAEVDIDTVRRTLRNSEALRLVWLNSCSGSVGAEGALYGALASAAARFVASGVPAVLANQVRISDLAARELSRAFYTNLADGMPIDVALAEARAEVSVIYLNSLEWATPVLYMRAPDGVLFALPNGEPAVTTQSPAQGGGSQPASASPPPPDPSLRQLQEQQLSTLKKRLYMRQLQKAQYGISVDPSVLIEIDNLEHEIADLEKQMGLR